MRGYGLFALLLLATLFSPGLAENQTNHENHSAHVLGDTVSGNKTHNVSITQTNQRTASNKTVNTTKTNASQKPLEAFNKTKKPRLPQEKLSTTSTRNRSIKDSNNSEEKQLKNLTAPRTIGTVRVGQPVTWTKRVEPGTQQIMLPGNAKNYEIQAVHKNGSRQRIPSNQITAEYYAQELQGTTTSNPQENLIEVRMHTAHPQAEYLNVTYESEPPKQIEERTSNGKHIVVSAETHYTNIHTTTNITPSPPGNIKLTRTTNNINEDTAFNYTDFDNDGLAEQIHWVVPHLSNQTYDLEITVLNPVTYVKNGENWTVYFNTTGTGNLTITSTNAAWTEIPVDNTSTDDEMQYQHLTCGNTTQTVEVLTETGRTPYDAVTSQTKPQGFFIPNYSCSTTSTITNMMRIAGYAELLFTYEDQNVTVQDTALDPASYNVTLIDPSSNQDVATNEFFNFTVNVTCLGGTCGDTNVTLDPVSWWNGSYEYRQPINVSNPSAQQTGYAVNLSIDTANLIAQGRLQSGCQDLRFTDDASTPQGYYVEEGCDTANTTVWVNVSNLAGNQNTTIYMYYGNEAANSASNPDETFPVYINFTRDGVSSYGGSQDNDPSQTRILNDTALNMWGNNWKQTLIPYDVTSLSNAVLEFEFNSYGVEGEINGVGLDTDDVLSQNRHYQVYGTQDWGTTESEQYDDVTGGWQLMTQVLDDYTGSFDRFFFTNDADSGQATNVTYRNVRIRSYTSPQPTQSSTGPVETTNKGPVSTTVGDIPFYTTSPNPYTPVEDACLGNMQAGDTCELTWEVNSTGPLSKDYTFFAFAQNTLVTNESPRINLTITDVTNPEVTPLTPADTSTYKAFETINISANITDNTGITSAAVEITYPNTTTNTVPLTQTTGNTYNASFTAPNLDGAYQLRYTASDAYGNTNNTETRTINVDGVGTLQATITNPPNNVNITQNTTFTATADITCLNQPCGNVTTELTRGTWWNTSWNHRVTLTLNTTGITTTQTDFPLLIKLNQTRVNYSNFQANANDLRVVDSDGETVLYHEVEHWDTTGESYIWANIPELNTGQDTVYVYYDNPAASNTENPAGIWQNYAAVWHLTNTSTTITDSTNAINGTNNGATPTTNTPLGPGLTFNESQDDNVNFGAADDYEGATHVTFEAWFQTTSTNSDDMILAKADTYSPLFWRDEAASPSGRSDTVSLAVQGTSDDRINGDTNALNDVNWHHVLVVFDGAQQEYRLYIDGVEDPNSGAAHSYSQFPTSTADLYMGDWITTPGYEFDGTIAESRIGLADRDADWALADYKSQADQLATYSEEQQKNSIRIRGDPTAKPFYTTTTNPQTPAQDPCLQDMEVGDTCSISWVVNATGNIDQTYDFFVTAESNQTFNAESSPTNVTIRGIEINRSDLTPTTITVHPVNITQNKNYSVNITVENVGNEAVSSAVVELLQEGFNGTYFEESTKTTTVSLNINQSTNISFSYIGEPGPYRFTATADPANTIAEENETNNNVSTAIDIPSHHVFYGGTTVNLNLSDTLNNTMKRYGPGYQDGTLFFTDTDVTYSLTNLAPLNGTNDLTEADAALNLTGHNDSLNALFDPDGDGDPDQTGCIEVGNGDICDIPLIESTNGSQFITGLLYDTTSGTPYDGSQPVIFTTPTNKSRTGKFGVYDYEIKIPFSTGTQEGIQNQISIQVQT